MLIASVAQGTYEPPVQQTARNALLLVSSGITQEVPVLQVGSFTQVQLLEQTTDWVAGDHSGWLSLLFHLGYFHMFFRDMSLVLRGSVPIDTSELSTTSTLSLLDIGLYFTGGPYSRRSP